ncbi:MAG TPA: efflux RND transporter periplasmic adaptor subunit [Steroidobacteraceae bacterium]|nr:efflux RND transporter periplasmic adaptor subunit [Steroidobacteraceae bacterium]
MRLSRIVKRCAAGALLIVAAASLAGCGSSGRNAPQGAAAEPPPVTVLAVEPQQVPLTASFTGRLSAYREANVLARVSGILLKRRYKEGTQVKAGQPLFEIDPAPYKAALDAALAALAQARANATNAHATAQRDRDLISSHLVSQQQLDTDEAAERSTAAAVKQAQANVESARINLGYTNVTSPITGIAGEQQVTEGALVGQGTPTLLTTVDQLDPIYVKFDEPAAQIEELSSQEQSGRLIAASRSDAKVQLALPDGTPYGIPGTLDFRAATVDPNTGTAALRGILPNPDHTLLPGMYVNLRLTVAVAPNAFLVPQGAVQRDTQGAYVYTVDTDQTVVEKRVQTVGSSGINWIVSNGLTAGDRIIVAGIQSAHPGAKVAATEEPKSGARPRAAATEVTPATGVRRMAAAADAQ